MVLLGDEEKDTQNRERRRAHLEMEMKMECDNLGVRRFHPAIEMENENGQQNKKRRAHLEMETEEGYSDDWEEEWMAEEEEERGGESENGNEVVAVGEINDGVGGYNTDMPPVDDVCPICFDRFTIPCRSNCGHWFCASCILQFWTFRSTIQPCKCPLCCSGIVNLKPETSQLIQPAGDIVVVLNKVHHYNGLHVNGVLGTFHRMIALPLFMGRIFRVLIDPDGLRCIYYIMRLLGLFSALLYERGEFEFIAAGGMGIQRMFDVGASVLVLFLFFIGIGYRWVLRSRARRLAAI